MRYPFWILLPCLAACGPSTSAVLGDAGASSGANGSSSGGATTSIGPLSCLIGGLEYPAGVTNPVDGCQICAPASSATSWSVRTCPASSVCLGGNCVAQSSTTSAGSSSSSGTSPGGSSSATSDSIGSSSVTTTSSLASSASNGSSSGSNTATAGSSSSGSSSGTSPSSGSSGSSSSSAAVTTCDIGGATFPDGGVNPSDPCQSCDLEESTSSWTDAADGTACGAGLICWQGSCQEGCDVNGVFYSPLAPNAADTCLLCEPANSATSWTAFTGPAAPGGSCSSSQVCNGGICATGCFVGGGFVAPEGFEPGVPCQSCQPPLSTSGWSPYSGLDPDGGLCDPTQVCNAGACTAGCYIDGGFTAPGGLDPIDACQTCQPGLSTNEWSPVSGPAPDGGCATGDVCYLGNCCAPACAGKCPGAADGCGGLCTGACAGCCDANLDCQPGTAADACTDGGGSCKNCEQTATTCNQGPSGYVCCTPGSGCGASCGDPGLVDQCGNVCPFNCPATSCCDAKLDCQPGTTDQACGTGGTLGSCSNCGAATCAAIQHCGCVDGDMETLPCTGNCTSGSVTSTCEAGEWVKTAGGCTGCPNGTHCQTNGTCS